VDGKVRRMRGPIAGLPLGCPDWLEHCEEQHRKRHNAAESRMEG
jgi:hypothetical protein